MNKWIFLGVGMAVGAGIGILATRGHYKKLAFDEINEARETFRKMRASKEAADRNDEMKRKMMSEGAADETKTGKTGIKSEKNDDFGRYSEISSRYLGKKEPENEAKLVKLVRDSGSEVGTAEAHNVFSNPPDPDEIDISDEPYEDEDDDPYASEVEHEAPRDGYSEPYEITEEEFASEKFTYDKVMIEYYTDGVAVLEESEQIIDCIEDLIGPDILNGKLNRMSKWDGDEIYIRNDSRSTDYGIIFTGTDYVPEEGLQD